MALPFLFAIFLYILYQNSDGLSQYNKQVILLTPPVLNVLAGYGILTPLAIYGIIKGKVEDSGRYLLILWAILLAILIYMPFPFQRRLLETFHLPIAISASLVFFNLNFKNIFSKFLLIIFLIILSAGNIYLTNFSIKTIASDTADSYSHHIYAQDMEGLLWVKENSSRDDMILANFYYSNIIPGITGRYVFSGHLYNTVDARDKTAQIERFMEGTKSLRKEFVEKNKPKFIFLGKVDPYNSFRDSLIKDGFVPAWEKDGVTILEVKTL